MQSTPCPGPRVQHILFAYHTDRGDIAQFRFSAADVACLHTVTLTQN